jgi:copper(I)-binding protein
MLVSILQLVEKRNSVKKIASILLAASLLLAPVAAQGATPRTNSACANSGAVTATAKFTMVCATNASGKLVWGKQLPVSKATLVMADAWVKSIDMATAGMMPMTAAFGTFLNPTKSNVRIIAAYTSSAPFLQLHEVVMSNGSMVMQQKAGGFVIPAKGSKQMKPGSDHTMFMSVAKNINPGEIVYITYVTSTGARFTQPFLAKVYVGGNETYTPTTN